MQNCLRWLPQWLGLFITFSASLKRCASMPFSSRLGEMSNLFQHGCEWPVAPLNGSCHSDTLAWGRPSRRAAVSRRSLRSVHRGDTCYATINERPRCALDGAWHGWNQISPAGASLASVSVPVCALSFSGITFCRQSNALPGSWQLKSSLDTNMHLNAPMVHFHANWKRSSRSSTQTVLSCPCICFSCRFFGLVLIMLSAASGIWCLSARIKLWLRSTVIFRLLHLSSGAFPPQWFSVNVKQFIRKLPNLDGDHEKQRGHLAARCVRPCGELCLLTHCPGRLGKRTPGLWPATISMTCTK